MLSSDRPPMEAPLLLPVSTITVVDDTASHECSPTSSPSTQSIVARYLVVIAVASVSLFAHHEASRGFRIDVVNAAPRDTVAGRRFDLFFVSNGRAERILHHANRGVEQALFPDASFPRRRVTRVTVRMSGNNLTADDATVAPAGAAPGEYVISLSPEVLSSTDKADDAVAAAVRRAVARMWLWDGRGTAPARVTESMVEYLAIGAEASSPPPAEAEAQSQSQCMSPRFLKHLEQRRSGFVARLNRAMKDRWSDAAVDVALGAPARPVCAAYLAPATTNNDRLFRDSTSDDARGSRVAAGGKDSLGNIYLSMRTYVSSLWGLTGAASCGVRQSSGRSPH